MQSAKLNIKTIVDKYIKDFSWEYEAFKEQMADRRASMQDEKFGTVQGKGLSIERAIFEMPETLHGMLVANLTEEQMKWLKEGGKNGHEGSSWFAKTFPTFRLPEKV